MRAAKVGSSTADFDTMRAAEAKRRRKRAANLRRVIAGHASVTARTTHLLWVPKPSITAAYSAEVS